MSNGLNTLSNADNHFLNSFYLHTHHFLNMKKFLLLLLLLPFLSYAQKKTAKGPDQPPYTPADNRLAGFDEAKKLQANSIFSQVEFRNVGPTIMSGRVVDVDVNPDTSSEFYVAYASGGVWYTRNNGTSF